MSSEDFDDPYLLRTGLPGGNSFRLKRAIVRLQQQEIDNNARIRDLKVENKKLREKLARLREKANETDRIEEKFEAVSTCIMESTMIQTQDSITE